MATGDILKLAQSHFYTLKTPPIVGADQDIPRPDGEEKYYDDDEALMYQCFWMKKQRLGTSTAYHKNRRIHIITWSTGKRHGREEIYDLSGARIYEADWKNDLLDGEVIWRAGDATNTILYRSEYRAGRLITALFTRDGSAARTSCGIAEKPILHNLDMVVRLLILSLTETPITPSASYSPLTSPHASGSRMNLARPAPTLAATAVRRRASSIYGDEGSDAQQSSSRDDDSYSNASAPAQFDRASSGNRSNSNGNLASGGSASPLMPRRDSGVRINLSSLATPASPPPTTSIPIRGAAAAAAATAASPPGIALRRATSPIPMHSLENRAVSPSTSPRVSSPGAPYTGVIASSSARAISPSQLSPTSTRRRSAMLVVEDEDVPENAQIEIPLELRTDLTSRFKVLTGRVKRNSLNGGDRERTPTSSKGRK